MPIDTALVMPRPNGFTLIELVVTISLIGTLSAIAVPVATTVMRETNMNTGEQILAGQLRQARLWAVTRDARVRVEFNCPRAGAIRTVTVTDENAAAGCETTPAGDAATVWLPLGVFVESGTALEFDATGVMRPATGTAPTTITIAHGATTRSITVTGSGRIAIDRP
jgi:prepilin-type N-terminal cleavage/methylation domain-containing protein